MSVQPGQLQSASIEHRPPPRPGTGELLVRGICVGICATDREVAAGRRGRPPEGADRIVVGHESLGVVVGDGNGGGDGGGDGRAGTSGPKRGDLVVGVVRRPDPQPCVHCAAGDWDYCGNGRYTSCGITGRDGYGAELWCAPARFLTRVDPRLGTLGVLVEPTSVLIKAWERIQAFALRSGSRTALVSGAGTMGLLAAMLAVQRDYRTYVLARRWTGRRTALVRSLGAVPVRPADASGHPAPDVVLDTTGSAVVIGEVLGLAARNAVVCLTGLADDVAAPPALAPVLDRLVTTNGVLFGTVNAALRHYERAVTALLAADAGWLGGLITRRVPVGNWPAALRREPDDIKVVVDLNAP
jgi:glucose 1-dehydrogenase